MACKAFNPPLFLLLSEGLVVHELMHLFFFENVLSEGHLSTKHDRTQSTPFWFMRLFVFLSCFPKVSTQFLGESHPKPIPWDAASGEEQVQGNELQVLHHGCQGTCLINSETICATNQHMVLCAVLCALPEFWSSTDIKRSGCSFFSAEYIEANKCSDISAIRLCAKSATLFWVCQQNDTPANFGPDNFDKQHL
jgi:hypothetical protein